MTNRKSFTPEFKAVSDDGTASWVMATLNTIDHDGDVILPGAFGEQTVPIVPAHDSNHVPLGKGRLYELGNEAIVEAKFNLSIPAARDWHSAIKFDLANPPSVQEYSFAYDLLPGGSKTGEFNGQQVRLFTPKANGEPGVDVIESSPVMRGAGINTRTLSAKSGLKFVEHVDAVLAEVDALVTRAADVVALRAEKGKGISEESTERLIALKARLEELIAQPAPHSSADAEWSEALDLLAAAASLQGVTTT